MKSVRQPGFTRRGDPITNFVPRLSNEEADKQANKWLVLRNKTRLRIMDLLSQYGGLLCVSEIAEVLNLQTGLVSSHLSVLRAVQLVSSEKHGAYVYYKLRAEVLGEYMQFLETF